MTDAQSPGRLFFNRQMNTAMKVRLQTSSKNLGLTVWNGAMDVVKYTLQIWRASSILEYKRINFKVKQRLLNLLNCYTKNC